VKDVIIRILETDNESEGATDAVKMQRAHS
jgi:hypothetical protein